MRKKLIAILVGFAATVIWCAWMVLMSVIIYHAIDRVINNFAVIAAIISISYVIRSAFKS